MAGVIIPVDDIPAIVREKDSTRAKPIVDGFLSALEATGKKDGAQEVTDESEAKPTSTRIVLAAYLKKHTDLGVRVVMRQQECDETHPDATWNAKRKTWVRPAVFLVKTVDVTAEANA